MRDGPKPLPLQIAMASMASAGLAGGTSFDEKTLTAYFRGLKKYQDHTYTRRATGLKTVWADGAASMNMTGNTTPNVSYPVVLVPSMVNRSDILDLTPNRSLLRYLSERQTNPYLFDWGAPADVDMTMDKAVGLLEEAVLSLGGPVLLLGYCMGGLFASALSYLRPDLVKGCILLATPWNFHDTAGALKARLSVADPAMRPYIRNHAYVPQNFLQGIFATLDPEGSIRKFAAFAEMNEGCSDETLFVAVEDWLNDGVDLPSAIAQACLDDWYGQNKPYRREWSVRGERIAIEDIKCPTLVVAAKKDKIVPPDAALAFAEQRVKCDTLMYDGGHVGLIAGRTAVQDVWAPVAEWCRARNAAEK